MLSVSKGNAHLTVRRYIRDAAHDGVTVQPGSVLFSDNERIYDCHNMESELDEQTMVHKFAAEYEPWGNGGVESVNRYTGTHIRDALIRGGAPDAMWPFVAEEIEHALVLGRRNMPFFCNIRPQLVLRRDQARMQRRLQVVATAGSGRPMAVRGHGRRCVG